MGLLSVEGLTHESIRNSRHAVSAPASDTAGVPQTQYRKQRQADACSPGHSPVSPPKLSPLEVRRQPLRDSCEQWSSFSGSARGTKVIRGSRTPLPSDSSALP